MKKLYTIALFLLVLCFTSCVDVEESFDFHADGSCNVDYNFDMSSAVSVLSNLMPDSLRQSPQFNMAKDTTMNFYSMMPDSSRLKLDSAQVAMTKGSDLVVDMNLRESRMKVSVRHSADNSAALSYYLKNVAEMTSEKRLGALARSSKTLRDVKGRQLLIGQDYFNYDIAPHKFYRSVDKEKFRKYIIANQPVLKMSKAMLIDMPYRVVMRFPSPVKRVDNPKAVISTDKLEVTIETNIEEAFNKPEVMDFKIDY